MQFERIQIKLFIYFGSLVNWDEIKDTWVMPLNQHVKGSDVTLARQSKLNSAKEASLCVS